jgi:hypothetical protein
VKKYKEAIKEKGKEYYQVNKDTIAEKGKVYIQNHKVASAGGMWRVQEACGECTRRVAISRGGRGFQEG